MFSLKFLNARVAPLPAGQLLATHPHHICLKVYVNGMMLEPENQEPNSSSPNIVTVYDGHVVEGGFPGAPI